MKRTWTPAQKAKACTQVIDLVSNGMSLRAACACGDDWTPSEALFRQWCDSDADLSSQYTRARDARSDLIFEQCLTIADSQEGDVYKDCDGIEQTNHDIIARAKLRIDTRKWMLGKMQPKKYGDKIEVDNTSSDGSMTPKPGIDLSKAPIELLEWIVAKNDAAEQE